MNKTEEKKRNEKTFENEEKYKENRIKQRKRKEKKQTSESRERKKENPWKNKNKKNPEETVENWIFSLKLAALLVFHEHNSASLASSGTQHGGDLGSIPDSPFLPIFLVPRES